MDRWRKRDREIEERERERERKEDSIASSSNFRHSDDQSWSRRELKSVYAERATLQEVGIFPTLVYFCPKGTGFRY